MTEPCGLDRISWRALHLYPAGSVGAYFHDGLASVIASLEAEFACFAVRYADELGPHIRLRVRRPANLELSNVPARGLRVVRPAAYIPELERYGGTGRIAISEEHFCASTAWVLRFGRAECTSGRERLLLGLRSWLLYAWPAYPNADERLTFLKGVLRENHYRLGPAAGPLAPIIEDITIRHRQWWSDALAETERAAGATANPSDAFGSLRRECERACAKLDPTLTRSAEDWAQRARIVASWMHMHANRIGLTNQQELLAAHCLLQHCRGNKAGPGAGK